MKNKKLFKSIIAIICAASLGTAALTGCSGEPECEHVYTWTVHEGDEPTCTVLGKRTGVCALCGDIKEEEIPIDPDAHDYSGEWQITKPTETQEGAAVKICSYNPEHTLTVTLPVVTLSGKGYDVAEFITTPTTVTSGEIHLELNHENGVISFDAELAKRTLNTVEDAVILASSLGSNVRTSAGYYKEATDALQINFATYFGDDYTNVKDTGTDAEFWYSYDEEGKLFAMSKSGDSAPLVVGDATAENLLGFGYQSGSNTSSFYGAEQGLKKLYKTAQTAREQGNCVNYRESLERVNQFEKSVRGQFSYSLFENPYFCRYDVRFETFNDGTLKSLEVYTDIIRAYMFITDLEGTPIFYKDGDSYKDSYGIEHKQIAGDVIFGPEYPFDPNTSASLYEYDDEGNYVFEQVDDEGYVIYITEDAEGNTVYKRVLGGTVTKDGDYVVQYQTLDYVPNLHDVYLTDAYGMEIVDANGEKVKKIMAQGGYPVDTYYSDSHSEVAHRYVVFNQTEKSEDDDVIPNPYDSNSLYVQSFEIISGTLSNGGKVLFTDNKATLPTNTVINLTIGNIMPETSGLDYDPVNAIYVVDPTGNRIQLKADFNTGSGYKIFAAYNSQSKNIMINSQYSGEVDFVFVTRAGKCEQHVTITFKKSAPTSLSAKAYVYAVSDGEAITVEQSVSLDSPVTIVTGQTLKIRATAAGNEAGYVSTDIFPSATPEGVTFTQAEQGNYEEWNLVASKPGTYTVRLPYFDGNSASTKVYATFMLIVNERPDPSGMVTGHTFTGTVSMSNGINTNPSRKPLTAEFAADGTLTVSVNDNTSVYSYSFDESGALVTEFVSGVEPTVKSYDFSFTVNEAGDLVVKHSSGMGNDLQEVVLTLLTDE